MQFLVQFEVFETFIAQDQIRTLRNRFGDQMGKILQSGKVLASGSFCDARGGFILLDVESSEEIFDLLGSALLDSCKIKTHPILSFDSLAKFFELNSIL